MSSAPMERPLVLIAEPIDDDALAWLRERANVVEVDAAADPAGFAQALSRAGGLIVRTYTRVDAALLERAPSLRAVARAGAGTDNIDADACAAQGVQMAHTPGANADAVAEYVVALLLDALRPRPEAEAGLDIARWSALRASAVAPCELGELTIGVVGLGNVGSRVARLTKAFGCDVIYHDIREIPPDQRQRAEPVELGALLERADVLTVHVDGRPENRNLIGAKALSRMKPDAIFINTSRGVVVDEQALADWLSANREARAILDVHATEPVPAGSPLVPLPNARLLPHIGAATRRAHAAMSQRAVEQLWRALRGSRAAAR